MSERHVVIHWDVTDMSDKTGMRPEVLKACYVINGVIQRGIHVQKIYHSGDIHRVFPKPDVIVAHVSRMNLGCLVQLIDPDDYTVLYGAQKSQCVDDIWQDLGRAYGFRHVRKHPVGTFD